MKRTLLADIGGTWARFAVLSGNVPGPVRALEVAKYGDPGSAIRSFVESESGGMPIDAAILGVAGPVDAGRCALTNSTWVVDATALAREFGFGDVRIVNDQEATAWSLPHLGTGETALIGPDTAIAGAPLAVLGPGTGLGMACLLQGAGARVLASEGGHGTLAAVTLREEAIFAVLRRLFGHVSAERVLSGDGLINLYRTVGALDGQRVVPRDPAAITRAALDGGCPICREALDLFCALLGSVAGNAALFFGARGGVYVSGGIAPHIVEHLARSDFRERFEAKGRFRPYLAAIPVRVILRPHPAFLGLMALAWNRDDGGVERPATRQASG